MGIYGENPYAQHSIIYPKLESHFYVFGIMSLICISWEEVKWYSHLDLPVVPEDYLDKIHKIKPLRKKKGTTI
jgi:hypothetical protein